MRTLLFLVIITVVGAFSMAYATGQLPWKPEGIITLPNYDHAVVICGEMTTINFGHERDPEITELLNLADKECPQ